VTDVLVVGADVGTVEDVVVDVELLVGMVEEMVEEVVGIEEELVGMTELLEKIIEDDVVDDSVVGIVELEAIANCLKTSFLGRLRFRSRSAPAGTQYWDCFVFGKSVGRALYCLWMGDEGFCERRQAASQTRRGRKKRSGWDE